MAFFHYDIPHDHNEMIKLAAKESFMSRQKYLEKLIIEAAEKQARIVLKKNEGDK